MYFGGDIQRSELRRFARSLRGLAEEIQQAEDFATETARVFCRLIQLTVELIDERLAAAPDDKLQLLHALLAELGSHLRFPDRSRIQQTPWSAVQATEEFLRAHVGPEYGFVIRPQWKYNYMIVGDFVELYRRAVDSLSPWLTKQDFDAKIGSISTQRIYCISFPRVERMNILSHVNWGHEVGHILGRRWQERRLDQIWRSEANAIANRIRGSLPSGLLPLEVTAQVATNLRDIAHLIERGFGELISDAIGAHLFGPAAFASLAEFSSHRALDVPPLQNEGRYPPWRYRLRQIFGRGTVKLSQSLAVSTHRKLRAFAKWGCEWQAIVDSDGDKRAIDSDVRSREAYRVIESHWDTVWKEVLTELPPLLRAPYDLLDRRSIVADLITRIDRGIPPNESGTWPKTSTASIADIWNAGWACKVTASDKAPNEFDLYLQTLYQLILKAIEASYVQTKFTIQPSN